MEILTNDQFVMLIPKMESWYYKLLILATS